MGDAGEFEGAAETTESVVGELVEVVVESAIEPGFVSADGVSVSEFACDAIGGSSKEFVDEIVDESGELFSS